MTELASRTALGGILGDTNEGHEIINVYADGRYDWAQTFTGSVGTSNSATPHEIFISNWSTLKLVSFRTGDNRPEHSATRVSPLYSFTKDDFTRDHDGWVYTNVSASEYQHIKETPTDYFFTMATVVDAALDTAVITLTETHATEANRYGAVTSVNVAYEAGSGVSVPTGTVTARYQPNFDYTAGDPIIEPNPADNFEPYIWTADEDHTSSADPDFDGTSFTAQEKSSTAVGLETDIVGGNSTPKLFAGLAIAKALDQTLDEEQIARVFRPALATQLYGYGGGKVSRAIDPNGKVYHVRTGATVTSNAIPSANLAEWMSPDEFPRTSLADLQAIPFPTLVNQTGLTLWVVDTQEQVVWDLNATPTNVAPRKTYVAAQTVPPVEDTAGRWVVTSPEPQSASLATDPLRDLLLEVPATVGGQTLTLTDTFANIKTKYHNLEFYAVSDGFGNPAQTNGAALLVEHLTAEIPFRIEIGGRQSIFTPKDNGAQPATLVNGSSQAGEQNIKLYGVKDQFRVIGQGEYQVDDAANAAPGALIGFVDDGNGGQKIGKVPVSQSGTKAEEVVLLNTDIAHVVDLEAADAYNLINVGQQILSGESTMTLSLTNFQWSDSASMKIIEYIFAVSSNADDKINIVLDPDSYIGTADFSIRSTYVGRVFSLKLYVSRGLKGQAFENPPLNGTIYKKLGDVNVPDATSRNYATGAEIPTLIPGDEVTVLVERNQLLFNLTSIYLEDVDVHRFLFDGGLEWRTYFSNATGIWMEPVSNGGAQVVKAIKITR